MKQIHKAWYKRWWGIVIAIITLPLFALWYVWTKLERSKVFRVSIIAALLVVYAGGAISLAHALPSPLTARDTSTKPTLTTQPTTSPNVTKDSVVATQPSTTPQTTPKTTVTSTSTSTTNTPTITPSVQPTAPTAPQTPTQQYPDTYPSKWSSAPLDTVIDTWNMSNRESTSYTAWKVNEAFGNMPTTWGGANATNWPTEAQNAGIPTGTTPKVHSVAIISAGQHGASAAGFSAWIEAINGDQVTISAYNYGGPTYSVSTVSASLFSTYIYFGGN